PSPVMAAVCGLAFAALFATFGAVRGGGGKALLAGLPEPVRAGLHGGRMALAVLITGTTVILIAALGWHSALVGHLAHVARGGTVGDIALGLVGVLLLPNAVLAAVGYLAGTGFSVGVG